MDNGNKMVEELFDRCREIATTDDGSSNVNRMMHETLVLTCAEATRTMGQGFGNVFSQVDYLCKLHGISTADRIAIQAMRRHSNRSDILSRTDRLYDVRALCLLISAVFAVNIPDHLVRIIPTENRPTEKTASIDMRYVRCIVDSWDEQYIHVMRDASDGYPCYHVDIYNTSAGIDLTYLRRILRKGMQINLLDCHVEKDVIIPQLAVIEPDFLVDISSVANCFTAYGHHPLLYTLGRMKPRANSMAILLGNFAGSALDDIINSMGQGDGDVFDTTDIYDIKRTIRNSFRQQALQFCTCRDFTADTFMLNANRQVNNLKEVVETLFADDNPHPSARHHDSLPHYERGKAVLEPSFVCEQLGLQGRVDLMTTDGRLLVEQKSGKNYNIERKAGLDGRHLQREDHYVQLLLYYGILRYNFHRSDSHVDIRLLYSRYPARQGLLTVNFFRQLFHEAIKFRNQVVATEYHYAKEGFEKMLPFLHPQVIYGEHKDDRFFQQYILPEAKKISDSIAVLSPLERAYFCRMMTFVYREQLIAKVGRQEGQGGSVADLWNMPLHEKKDTGNIYTGLTIEKKRQSSGYNGYDEITLRIPDQGEDFLPNFRCGDMVYLYSYPRDKEPDVRRSLLFKGVLSDISSSRITVNLNDGQQNPNIFTVYSDTFAIEHASSDTSASNDLRGLYEWATAPPDRRQLLLGVGRNTPRRDKHLHLTRTYNPTYDDVLLKAKQARDYFLLIGPPGTGKTSMALRFMIQEELESEGASLLLTSYTNRAVDEICGMLTDAGLDYIRIGNHATCDRRFHDHLLSEIVEKDTRVCSIRSRLLSVRIIVSTTSTLQSRPFIFDLKRFSLAIIDEASQILEPSIIGILAAHGRGAADGRCNIEKFILVGDYKQLPAVVQQSEEDASVKDPLLNAIGLDNCRDSLFERLIRHERNNGREDFIGILRRQGRMHPDIAAFPNEMFYFHENLCPVPCEHQLEKRLAYDAPSDDAFDDLLKRQRMTFIPSAFCRDIAQSDKVNPDEARIVADIMTRIHRFYGPSFDTHTTIGVIVPYRNQIAMIRKEIERATAHLPQKVRSDLMTVSIDTVERYQGSQRDVIIYSFTVQTFFQLDFLTANSFMEDGRVIDRKLNVAITRARKQMIMTGNENILKCNPVFNQLIERYRINGEYKVLRSSKPGIAIRKTTEDGTQASKPPAVQP